MGRQCRHAETILHVGDGARRRDGLCADHLLHHGLRLFRRRDVAAIVRFPAKLWAWGAFWMAIVGVVMVLIPILMGQASVLFTFYPPLTASPWFYIGLVLVVVGSWIWCVLMLVAMREWKRENPGRPVPLAMFATVANAVMWLWTTVGVAVELLFQVIPASLGHRADHRCGSGAHAVLVDAARHRLFLAHPGIHRVLHDHPARGRRTALQRYDGPPHLHSVSGLQPAGRHASSDDGPTARQRLEVHPDAAHRLRVGADAADDLHHHGVVGNRRTAARRPRRFRLDRQACRGTGRPCSRPALPSSCSASAGSAG